VEDPDWAPSINLYPEPEQEVEQDPERCKRRCVEACSTTTSSDGSRCSVYCQTDMTCAPTHHATLCCTKSSIIDDGNYYTMVIVLA